MAEDNTPCCATTNPAILPSSSDITNKDVYEFYKSYKDSESSIAIAENFVNCFEVETTAKPLTLYNKVKSVYDKYIKKKT